MRYRQAFFALPEPVKARIDKIESSWFRGWERVGAELTDNRVDHREQIDVWTEHFFVRSYPELVQRYHPDAATTDA